MPPAVPRWNTLSAPLKTHNATLRARSRVHTVKDFAGPLSIKSVVEGAVAWKTGGRELVVNRDSFLVLNAGEPYSMEIESRAPVSTLCVFFQDGFVEGVHASVTRDGIEPEPGSRLMLSRLHTADEWILPRMRALSSHPVAPLWLDEQYLELAAGLLLLEKEVRQRVNRMPARRPSTREELYRRVRRGQELLHAQSDQNVSLAHLARESCLSQYHFHRAFTCAFGRTPHQYQTDLRLAEARRLVENTRMTVTEIAAAVGFESAPSFTNRFRQVFGQAPRELRTASASK